MTRVGRAVDGAGVGEFRGMMRVVLGGSGTTHGFGVVDRLVDFLEDGVAPIVHRGANT